MYQFSIPHLRTTYKLSETCVMALAKSASDEADYIMHNCDNPDWEYHQSLLDEVQAYYQVLGLNKEAFFVLPSLEYR